jgi:hypothetical protein
MNNILQEKLVLISVMGPHAGESEEKIFSRKTNDIEKIGKTFWLIRSHQARPDTVQKICKEAKADGRNAYCIFIKSSSRGGATPTKIPDPAKLYSDDKKIWNELPVGLSPVTGKIDSGAYALIFSELRFKLVIGSLDLWKYADFSNQSKPIKIMQGGSTLCAVKKEVNCPREKRIKSRFRDIVAVGKLTEPYGVWLK